MLIEQVVHLQIFALKAAGDRVVTQRISTANHQLLNLPIQRVGLPAVVLTEIHIDLIEFYAKLGEILTRNRFLQKIHIAERITDFS